MAFTAASLVLSYTQTLHESLTGILHGLQQQQPAAWRYRSRTGKHANLPAATANVSTGNASVASIHTYHILPPDERTREPGAACLGRHAFQPYRRRVAQAAASQASLGMARAVSRDSAGGGARPGRVCMVHWGRHGQWPRRGQPASPRASVRGRQIRQDPGSNCGGSGIHAGEIRSK